MARLPRVQAGHPDLLLVGQLGQAEFAARHHQGACEGLQQQEGGQRRTAAPTAGRACDRQRERHSHYPSVPTQNSKTVIKNRLDEPSPRIVKKDCHVLPTLGISPYI